MYLNMKGNIVILKLVMGNVHHLGFWMWMHTHWETVSILRRKRLGAQTGEGQERGGWNYQYKFGCMSSASPCLFLLGPSKSNKENRKHKQKLPSKISARTSKISSLHRSQGGGSSKNKGERCQQQQMPKSTKGKWEYILTGRFLKEVLSPSRPHFVAVSKKWYLYCASTQPQLLDLFFFTTNR